MSAGAIASNEVQVSLAGGVLGATVGVTAALWFGTAGIVLSCLPLVFSQLRHPSPETMRAPGENRMTLIYHITPVSTWEQARRDGEYTMSTLDKTLAQEGFIHASTAGQVAQTANKFYQGVPDLLILSIDVSRVRPEIRWEQVPGSADPFPHIYGPLNVDAVVQATPLEPDPSGRFAFVADEN